MSKYQDYFDIDPKYFPCVDDSALRAGVDWMAFFPHETFAKLLVLTERILARQDKTSLWIEGAYGTGKSYAVWALKNILECPDRDLETYFERHPSKLGNDLLTKLKGHKAGMIVVAHRYASSSIRGDRDLICAVQESVRRALDAAKLGYKGENTLRESAVAWIENATHKAFFDTLLKSETYRHSFHGKSADDVLAQLKGGGDVHDLMEAIFTLASNEGVTALDTDMKRLIAWIEDVIVQNKLKALVLVWDEFSEYFKNNAHSLTEFQNLASVCTNKPFYLVIVTHESGSLFNEQNPDWKKLRDRFHRTEIALPENIAFDLMAHALVKKEPAKAEWENKADHLNSRMTEARKKVADATGVKEDVLRKLLPLHPMAALLLKHIAKSFKSNQRSMFDFIKNGADDKEVKAFQWFISKYGPYDSDPLLTVDHLWNFFYERGKDDLAPDIRAVLDSLPRAEGRLMEDEKRVLKTVLVMQAVGQKLGSSVELFRTTAANLALAFEGTVLESSAVNIANKLVRDEILFDKPFGGGRTMFAAVTVAGDAEQLEKDREFFRNNSKTGVLIAQGGLVEVLPLTPAQRLRWKIKAVTVDDFTRETNLMRSENAKWRMKAVIGFAKDNAERDALRILMKDAAEKEEYKDILFIDAMRTPLGTRFAEYVDYMANHKYHQGKDNALATDMQTKGRALLTDWRDDIYKGAFVFYNNVGKPPETIPDGQAALKELTAAALRKYPLGLDGFSGREMLFGLAKKTDVEKGIKALSLQVGAAGEKEKKAIVDAASPKLEGMTHVFIRDQFEANGRVAVLDIFHELMDIGFMPANLYGYLTGTLLKDYADAKYRWSDGQAAETMTVEKLAEAIAEAIKHVETPMRNYREKFIVLMTPEEKAFNSLTAKVFGLNEANCVSVEQTSRLVSSKMKELAYPLWVLESSTSVPTVVGKYLLLVNPQGMKQSDISAEIGKVALTDATLEDRLVALVTKANVMNGMRTFLDAFEVGKAVALAKAIGAEADLLTDVKSKFDSSEALWLWDRATGEDRIYDLILDYEVVEASNAVNPPARSLKDCYSCWRDRLKFVKMPWEALKTEFPTSGRLFDALRDIAQNGSLMSEKRRAFLDDLRANTVEIKSLFNDATKHFKSVYHSYLSGLGDADVARVSGALKNGLFVCEKSEAYRCVNDTVEEIKKNQHKTRLRQKWQDKTGSKTPREWAQHYKTPILCLAPDYCEARKAFDTLNRANPEEAEIRAAEDWLERAVWLADLSDRAKRNEAFVRHVIGRYAPLLPCVDKVRDLLSERLTSEPFDWFPSPEAKAVLEREAMKRYEAGGSDSVAKKIDLMDDATLKAWLKKLVKDNMTVGIEIIGEGHDD
jgi:hypothetical protein